jgi:hypothetical protein
MTMNPLIGWAQIRPMGFVGPSTAGASKTFEDGDNTSNVSTMQSRLSIEQEVDDIMLEEFEDNPTPIPTELASLPWTEEYRAASRAADQRVARRKEVLQMELEDAPKLWELSSEDGALVVSLLDRYSLDNMLKTNREKMYMH